MSIHSNGTTERATKRRKLSASPEAERISSRRKEMNGDGSSNLPPTGLTKSSILAVQVQQLLSETKLDLTRATSIPDIYQETARSCPAFTDVSRLASIWLQQRKMGSLESQGGFGSTEWNSLCAVLLETGSRHEKPLLSPRYTAVQLFKAVLQFIATKDLTTSMTVRSKTAASSQKTDLPVLYDGVAQQNLFSKMTAWSYQALREEASLTLAALNAENEDNFDKIFVFHAAEPLLKFDALYQVEVPSTVAPQTIFGILTQGFGDRAKRIHITVPDEDNLLKKSKKAFQNLTVGLILNPSTSDRLIDHGPSAEDTEAAAKFRSFWGAKAELRRFKDGSILESLVWSNNSPLPTQIIECLLQRHLHIQPAAISSLTDQVNDLIVRPQNPLKPADAFKLLSNAYQTLTTQLYALEDLPLRIRSITPADSQLSSSSLVPPLSSISSLPADVYISFENSTRWPDHLPAIQHTKIAFLLKLGETMQAAHAEITARVGLEHTETASTGYMNTGFLDIIYPSPSPGLPPLSFRLRIHHDREITLLEKALASKPAQSQQLLLTSALHAQRSVLALQKHTTTLRLLTTRFPGLSETIRLLKKWTSSHLLPPSLLPSPILDLLAIHTFTQPAAWSTPTSPQTAFLRTLHTISHWNWTTSPLLIDTSQDNSFFPSTATITNLQTRFRAWRKLDPNLQNVVLFIGTNLDPTGVIWTQNAHPPRVVAARLTALAKASLAAAVITNHTAVPLAPEWKRMFQTPMDGFDFLIHLNIRFGHVRPEEKSSSSTTAAAKRFKNLQLQETMNEDNVGFDPAALYLHDLEMSFGGGGGAAAALFFHDGDGGKVIAGLWNPRINSGGEKEFRVRLGWNSMPVVSADGGDDDEKEEGEKKGKVRFNAEAVLAEIAAMGDGIVKRIEVRK